MCSVSQVSVKQKTSNDLLYTNDWKKFSLFTILRAFQSPINEVEFCSHKSEALDPSLRGSVLEFAELWEHASLRGKVLAGLSAELTAEPGTYESSTGVKGI